MGNCENLYRSWASFAIDDKVRKAPQKEPVRLIRAARPTLGSSGDLPERMLKFRIESPSRVGATLHIPIKSSGVVRGRFFV